MNKQRIWQAAEAWVLAVALAQGALGCLVTAFGWQVNLGTVALACCLGALAGLGLGMLRAGLLGLGLWLLSGLWLWRQGVMELSVETLLYSLTQRYHGAYGWGVVYWSEAPPQGDMTLALCYYGALAAMLLAWTLIRGTHPLLPGAVALAPGVACLVMTDTVPQEFWLFALLVPLALLLLSQGTRERHPEQAGRLTLLLAGPVALGVLLLLLLVPQQTYARQNGAQALENWVVQWQKKPVQENLQQMLSLAPRDTQSLSALGPRKESRRPVMEVTAQETGPLYLRGQIYTQYDGTSWEVSAQAPAGDYLTQDRSYTLEITTRRVLPVRYLPYETGEILTAGRVANIQRQRQYTVQYRPLQTPTLAVEQLQGMEEYLDLPQAVKTQAQKHLPSRRGDLWDYAQAVAQKVCRSARYDLNTGAMPREEEDFTLWFLRESDTGYCVHFATATVVLLRSAGIPARYVTGYLVQARAGEPVTVYEKDAHAWVECYLPGMGWQLLEPTPAPEILPAPTKEPVSPTQVVVRPQEPEAAAPTQPTPEEETPTWQLPGWLPGVLLWSLLVVAVPLQWRLRLRLRKGQFARGSHNQRALARYREITRHCRIRRCRLDRELLLLAQRAKFSNHPITQQELELLDAWLAVSVKKLKKQVLLWPVHTLVLALY